jgi:phage I-like protein
VVALQQQVREVSAVFQNVNSQVTNLQRSVGSLDGRLTASLGEGGTVRLLDSKIENVRQQVGALQSLDVLDVQKKLADLGNIRTQLDGARSEIAVVRARIGP